MFASNFNLNEYTKGLKIKPKRKTMAYNNYAGKSPEESKRISWLSVFSSLMQAKGEAFEIDKIVDKAYEITDELFNKYQPEAKVVLTEDDGTETPFRSDVCKDCGAKMVKNPKTGKIFCSDKCWLRKK